MSRTQIKNQKKVRRIIAEAVRQSTQPLARSLGTSRGGGSTISPALNFNTQADEDGNTKIPGLFDLDNWDRSYWQ